METKHLLIAASAALGLGTIGCMTPVDVVGPECLDEEPFELAVPPLPGLEEAQETPTPTAPTTPTVSETTPAVTPPAGR